MSKLKEQLTKKKKREANLRYMDYVIKEENSRIQPKKNISTASC